MNITEKDFPGLYQSADRASIREQKNYFRSIAIYLILLIIAAAVAFLSNYFENSIIKIISALFFLITLSITIWIKYKRPDDIWYNGRAVAESVKTRTWRWMMRADPYQDNDINIARGQFINDLKEILKQNRSLVKELGENNGTLYPITDYMINLRNQDVLQRVEAYKKERIENQALWYNRKARYNRKKSTFWFWLTCVLHAIAIIMLLYNIDIYELHLPIEVLSVAASSILTWIQAKKYNELSSSYTLTAHEISLIRSEVHNISTEEMLSEYVINCESAFSREHTQWVARKND